MSRRLACFIALTMLAACAHAPSSNFVPGATQLPTSFARMAAAEGTLVVTVTVPETSPGFMSPSTKSVVIAAYNGTGKTLLAKKVAEIGAKAHGCTSSAPALTCVILFSVPAGKDLFNVTAFDRAKGKGNALAALLKFPHKVAKGKTSVIGFALGGIAKSIDVEPTTSGISGTTAGYTIYGTATQSFTIVTKDADGNVILGAKSPLVKVVGAPTSATIATPSPTTLNFTSTYNPSDPTVPATTSIAFQASPVANSGGKSLHLTVPITMYEPRIYVADYSAGKILAFDQEGKSISLPAGAFTLPDAGYMVYSPSNKLIYADDYANTNAIYAFNLSGAAQTLSGTFPGLNFPGQPAFDTKNNLIYVPNYSATTTGQVTVYNLQGVAQATSPGTFAGMENGAWLMSYDSVHDRLYGFNYNQSTGGAWNSAGALVSTGPFTGMFDAYGLAVDTKNGQIYSGNASLPTVYDQEGNAVSVSGHWSGIPNYATFAYDSLIDTFFVASYHGYSATVLEYDPDGNLQTLPAGAFAGLVQPMGVLVVP